MGYDVSFLRIPFETEIGGEVIAIFDLPDESLLDEEDQKVVISGFGRSGSNLVTEMVRGTRKFLFTHHIRRKDNEELRHTWIEDRTIFTNTFVQIPRYGTKCVTNTPHFSWENIKRLMDSYNMYIVFCVRHPVSAWLAGIVRGLPWEDGGDAWWYTAGATECEVIKTYNEMGFNDDDVVRNAVENYKFGADIFVRLLDRYPDRVLTMPLESVIEDVEREASHICTFLDVPMTPYVATPWEYVRHNPIRHRYVKGGLDKTQINLHEQLDTAFGGFYKGEEALVERLLEALEDYMLLWGYAV